MDVELQNKILAKITINENGCWISHLAPSITTGYCSMGYKRKKQDAHRFSYEAFIGKIPPKMKVCHSCDVRTCVNPDHLFLGTDQENMTDAARKGRMARKFSEEEVLLMRSYRASGLPYKEIADIFSTTYFVVYAICRRWRWNHI